MRARPSMISSLFAANEGPRKFVLLPFRQLLGGLGACKAELGDPLAAALRFRICTFEIDGDAENRSGAFVVLPRPCRLSPNCKTESR